MRFPRRCRLCNIDTKVRGCTFLNTITPAFVRDLIDQGESTHIEFKEKQFPFGNKSAPEKALGTFLKAMLALANTARGMEAYLLIGIENGSKRVLGESQHPDQATPQQFLNARTNKPINFSYQKVLIEDKQLGVYCIHGHQPYPLFAKETLGECVANIVWYRTGSVIRVRTPDELLHEAAGRRAKETLRGPGIWSGEYGQGAKAMVDRWFGIMKAHKVQPHWIARLFPSFEIPEDCLGDWRDVARFLSWELREETCRYFNICREWLEEGTGPIMETTVADKGMNFFLRELVQAINSDVHRQPVVYAFKSGKSALERWWALHAGAMLIQSRGCQLWWNRDFPLRAGLVIRRLDK